MGRLADFFVFGAICRPDVWCIVNVGRAIYQIKRRKGKLHQPQDQQSLHPMGMQEAQQLEFPALVFDFSRHRKYLQGEVEYFGVLGRLSRPHARTEGDSKIF